MENLIGYYGPPPELNAYSLDDIRISMLGVEGKAVTPDNHPDRVIGKYGLFSDYMAEFEQAEPDLYLFPTYSSFPLVDAVRGYYDERNIEMPEVDAIKIDSSTAYLYEDGLKVESVIKPISDEIKRLFRHVGKRAVLIDQYVASGTTLRVAKHMLNVAGVSVVGATDEAQWYMQADLDDYDKQDKTSRFANQMRNIGREAAKQAMRQYFSTELTASRA